MHSQVSAGIAFCYVIYFLLLLYTSIIPEKREEKLLLILNGQLRGGNITWHSLLHSFINFYSADLAYVGPPLDSHSYVSRSLQLKAKWVWEYNDPEDWATYFVRPGFEENDRRTLRDICTEPILNKQQFLGGVKLDGACSHPGSAGMLLSYRRLAYEKLIENNLAAKYTWIVYSRADYFYLCSPPDLDHFSMNKVYVPKGEGYGGITDRLHFIPSHLAVEALNITNHFLTNSIFWLDKLVPLTKNVNLEKLLKIYYESIGIEVEFFDHVAFTARVENDPTSWSVGSSHPSLQNFGIKPKYREELFEALETCAVNLTALELKACIFQHNHENLSSFEFFEECSQWNASGCRH